ncbi:hypothetical protein RchiOBHm_Chr5g0027371 [Rosa chinensis]|uniref:Uncharacterized protein n=1 Tax=Rosa chinensis TaxID=74649 RepID=A0A2P6Q936_ROSCH|nr:hypothetical protein RchiOBHm_Chr5g0027371 [Rosa chinensis]
MEVKRRGQNLFISVFEEFQVVDVEDLAPEYFVFDGEGRIDTEDKKAVAGGMNGGADITA